MAGDREAEKLTRDYNYGWNDAPASLRSQLKKRAERRKSDPGFSQFIKDLRHEDVADIEARLKEALANGEFNMKDQDGNLIDPADLDLDTFRVKFPDEITEDSQLEMYVAAKDGREVGIGVKVGDVDRKNVPANLEDVEEALREVQKMPPSEQANLVIEMVAEAYVDGNEHHFRTSIEEDHPNGLIWDAVSEKALRLLASQGRAPKRPLGPPGMRGFLWLGSVPEGPRLCPRCGDTWIPINEAPGEYQGAMSRVRVGRGRPATEHTAEYASRCIEICSPCGQDEAMGRGIVPMEDWPIGKGEFYYDNRFFTDAMRDAIKQGRVQLQNEETGELIHSDGDDVELVSVDGDEVHLRIGTGDGTPVMGRFLDDNGNKIDLTGKDI